MRMNRVQFQPGLSMPDFINLYGTEAQCETALAKARWPEEFQCPGCGHRGPLPAPQPTAHDLSMQRLPPTELGDCWHRVPRLEPASDDLVFGH